MRTADVIILGGGIIGLSLAFELRKTGRSILILEKREPGLEASHAAAGMLAPFGGDLAKSLRPLALASARVYPEFVQEVEDASGLKADLRQQGTILFANAHEAAELKDVARRLSIDEQRKLEPELAPREGAMFLEEHSVDSRLLTAACLQADKNHGVHVATGEEAKQVCAYSDGLEVKTQRTTYAAPIVVNCCGAWAGEINGPKLPARPVKGQMLSVVTQKKNALKHVIHAPDVYIVPRSDGRIVIGATVEEAGFDKRVEPEKIQAMHQAAADVVPCLGEAKMLEAWAGLRPSSPDDLPVLGSTPLPGYYVATAHFRNGILLAPITAKLMSQLIAGQKPDLDIAPFSVQRFSR